MNTGLARGTLPIDPGVTCLTLVAPRRRPRRALSFSLNVQISAHQLLPFSHQPAANSRAGCLCPLPGTTLRLKAATTQA